MMHWSLCMMHWSRSVMHWNLSVMWSNCLRFVVALLWFNHYMMHNMLNNMVNWCGGVMYWLLCCVMLHRSSSCMMDGLRVVNRHCMVLNWSLMVSDCLGR